jgi:hypothetical protein
MLQSGGSSPSSMYARNGQPTTWKCLAVCTASLVQQSEKFDGNARLAVMETDCPGQAIRAMGKNGTVGRGHDSMYGKLYRALDAEHEVCTMGKSILHI